MWSCSVVVAAATSFSRDARSSWYLARESGNYFFRGFDYWFLVEVENVACEVAISSSCCSEICAFLQTVGLHFIFINPCVNFRFLAFFLDDLSIFGHNNMIEVRGAIIFIQWNI